VEFGLSSTRAHQDNDHDFYLIIIYYQDLIFMKLGFGNFIFAGV
jgi:hypothetical protein